MSLYYIASEENMHYLAHHGVRGMKWGRRKNRSDYSFKSKVKRSGLMAAKGANYASGTILKGISKASDSVFGKTKVTKALSDTSNKLYDNSKSLDKKRKSIKK